MKNIRRIRAAQSQRLSRSVTDIGVPGMGGGGTPTPTPTPVYSPIPAGTPLAIGLGERNGVGSGRAVSGPGLTNWLGDGRSGAGTGAAGAIAMRVRFQPSGLNTNAASQTCTLTNYIAGTGNNTAPRSWALLYVCAGVSGGGQLRERFCWYGRDFAGAYCGDGDANGQGSVAAPRYLRSPVIKTSESGVFNGLIVMRRNAAGQFSALIVYPDGTVEVGDSFTPATWIGMQTLGAMMLGTFQGSTLSQGNYFSGSLSDFIQVDGTGGTDAEWSAVGSGADPATVFGANLAAHYPMKGISDLAKGSGSRTYAALTLAGTGHISTAPLRPTRSTTTAANGVMAMPLYRGYVHALDPVAVRAVANLSALQALTGTVSRDIIVIGAATHVEGRAIRKSDNLVVRDWVRCTASAATGKVAVLIPGVPANAGELRFEFRREDDPACVAIGADDERVGIVAVIGPAQSQSAIALTDGSTPTLTPNANTSVSYCIMRGNSLLYNPVDGGYLNKQNQLSDAMVAMAQYWDSLNCGVGLEIVALSVAGTNSTEWMYHKNSDGLDYWGDNVNPSSGLVTATMLAKRKRVTMMVSSWHTSEQANYLGGSVGAISTIYGSVTPTELAWTERWNELFGGVEKSTADATERSQRNNFIDSGLCIHQPWVVIMPVSRAVAGAVASTTSQANSIRAFRKVQHDYAESGAGKHASVLASLGGYQLDVHLDSASTPHQHRTDARGNIRFALRFGHAIAHTSKASTINPRARLASVSGAATAVLTVATTLVNGGSLTTNVNAAPIKGLEVSVDGGTSWSTESGAVAFTPALSGNSVTLTKATGNWPAGTLVRYLPGYPLSTGSLATDGAAIDGMLAETRADAVPAGISLSASVPLMPTFDDLVAA